MTSYLRHALAALSQVRILVVGDVMLDHTVFGSADRVSPEAPVLVVRAQREEEWLGGAGHVATLLRAWGAQVDLCGVTGDDTAGGRIREIANEMGINVDMLIVDEERMTTRKQRTLGAASGHRQQMLARVDYEDTSPLRNCHAELLSSYFSGSIHAYDLVAISDYGKGVCTRGLCQLLANLGREHNTFVAVDPFKNSDLSQYRGSQLLKINRTEAALASRCNVDTVSDATAIASRLREENQHLAVVVTLDRDGMVLVDRQGSHYLSTVAQLNGDVTGAGDVVLAAIAGSIASGASLSVACQTANIAARLSVNRTGSLPISLAELVAALPAPVPKLVPSGQAAEFADWYRSHGKRIVFTNGCFDLLHIGHVTCLENASQMADVLFVAVNSDKSVARIKGDNRPIVKQQERLAMISALSCVDHVVMFDEETPERLLGEVRPDVLVKGGDYAVDDVVGAHFVRSYGGRVEVVNLVPTASTTQRIAVIAQQLGAFD